MLRSPNEVAENDLTRRNCRLHAAKEADRQLGVAMPNRVDCHERMQAIQQRLDCEVVRRLAHPASLLQMV